MTILMQYAATVVDMVCGWLWDLRTHVHSSQGLYSMTCLTTRVEGLTTREVLVLNAGLDSFSEGTQIKHWRMSTCRCLALHVVLWWVYCSEHGLQRTGVVEQRLP